MPVIKPTCPECGKQTEVYHEYCVNDSLYLFFYKCGHMEQREKLKVEDKHDWTSLDGKQAAYEYQKTGVLFTEACDYNCLIADAMGSGKTNQALIALKNNKKNLTP